MALARAEETAAARPSSLPGLLWLAQRLSALLLVGGLGLHLVAIHLLPGSGVTFEQVMARLASPGWRLFEALFLVVVTGHALGGLWILVEDYVGHRPVRRLILLLLVALGVEVLGLGLYTLATLPAG
jgi:succinate dehydrogenase / fumarate reductase membrane anchor subunit